MIRLTWQIALEKDTQQGGRSEQAENAFDLYQHILVNEDIEAEPRMIVFSSCMNEVWNFGSVFPFNKVREPHLHDACPVTYQNRKIDNM